MGGLLGVFPHTLKYPIMKKKKNYVCVLLQKYIFSFIFPPYFHCSCNPNNIYHFNVTTVSTHWKCPAMVHQIYTKWSLKYDGGPKSLTSLYTPRARS